MSPKSAGLAKKMGYTNVRVFHAGLPAWKKAHQPMASSVEFVEKGNIILVDLRSPDQVAKGYIPRAVNIPVNILEDADGDFPIDRTASVVLYSDKREDITYGFEEIKEVWAYKKVTFLPEGIGKWLKAGKTLKTGPAPDSTTINWVRKLAPGEISIAAFAKAIDSGAATMIDVRDPEEYEKAHIKGAMNIPAEEIAARMSEIPSGVVIVHCGTGARAEMAFDTLKDKLKSIKYLNHHVKFTGDGGYEISDS